MRTIGMDVHTHFAEVAILGEGQGVQRERIETNPSSLRAFASKLGPQDQVVLEATVNTWAIVNLLREHAGKVVVSNPMKTRIIAEAKAKTDQIDAKVLAQLLAADFLPEVWIPDDETRSLRRLVSHRSSLLHERTRVRNRITGVLQRNLLECPRSDTFGKAGMTWLRGVELPAEERAQVDSSIRLIEAVDVELEQVDNDVARRVVELPSVRHLMTIPGVGVTVAASLVAVIGDVHRFSRPNQLVSYLGLDPRVRQSGDRPAATGHISRKGQAHARSLLVEAAFSASRVPGPLRVFQARLKVRKGSQVANVAVARKLAVLAWHLLTKEQDYTWASPTLTQKKRRALELAAGAVKGSAGGIYIRTTVAARREQERAVLVQAERAYQLVAEGSRRRDAAAPKGETTGWHKAGSAAEVASPILRSSPRVSTASSTSIDPIPEGRA